MATQIIDELTAFNGNVAYGICGIGVTHHIDDGFLHSKIHLDSYCHIHADFFTHHVNKISQLGQFVGCHWCEQCCVVAYDYIFIFGYKDRNNSRIFRIFAPDFLRKMQKYFIQILCGLLLPLMGDSSETHSISRRCFTGAESRRVDSKLGEKGLAARL